MANEVGGIAVTATTSGVLGSRAALLALHVLVDVHHYY